MCFVFVDYSEFQGQGGVFTASPEHKSEVLVRGSNMLCLCAGEKRANSNRAVFKYAFC